MKDLGLVMGLALLNFPAEDHRRARARHDSITNLFLRLHLHRSVAVEPGNEWFVTGAADRVIKMWDLASGKLKLSLTGHVSTVRGLAVSTRHPYLFSAGEDRQVRVLDRRSWANRDRFGTTPFSLLYRLNLLTVPNLRENNENCPTSILGRIVIALERHLFLSN